MAITEIGADTWRIESLIGVRNLFQYVVRDGDEAMLVDTGTTRTPHEVIAPALRSLGIAPEHVRLVLVTHPDLDHQGGLAGLVEMLPNAVSACGFADRGLVGDPERLVSDRYGAYEREHGVGYGDGDKAWMRSLYGAPVPVDVGFGGGETVGIGDRRLEVLHLPGHSAGHLGVWEEGEGNLFSSDAVHWRMCPAAEGTAALPPTYEEVDDYLGTLDLVERLGPNVIHSGHWPEQAGEDVRGFVEESRQFVSDLDGVLLDRLETPATLAELCDHAEERLGPFGAPPVNLMFVVHGHLRRLVRQARVHAPRPLERPPRYEVRVA